MFGTFGPPSSPEAQWLKEQITNIILTADRTASRSQQKQLGASDLSHPCNRYVAYKMMQLATLNEADPWPAIMGTAIHMWLEKAINRVGPADWKTEVELPYTEDIVSHGDLFIEGIGWVTDHKSAGKDRMTEVTKKGPPEKHITQVDIYGLGYELQGYKVNKVSLIYYPRAGRLKDIYTWVGEYDRQRAFNAIDRVPLLAKKLGELQVWANPHRWEQVPATPSHDCGYCPFYDVTRSLEAGASDTGCPGG